MPQIKGVESLYQLCISSFIRVCVNCVKKISPLPDLCEAIIEDLNANYMDKLNSFINETLLHSVSGHVRLNDNEKLLLLKLFRNRQLRQFSLKFRLPFKEGFYELYFFGLNKLVVLNLTKICTDEILEVVGDNCHLLEIVYIISRTESACSRNQKDWNALRMKYFVSDEGLRHLHKCQLLKRIYMDRIIRSFCAGRKITHNGLISLIHALPNLEYVSYEDMGRVLEASSKQGLAKSFKLLHVHDNHMCFDHVNTFSKSCPLLQTLCLSILPGTEEDASKKCLQALSDSTLLPLHLMLTSFPIETAFMDFLTTKGNHLVSLGVNHDFSITAKEIYEIGIRCKILENFSVKLLRPCSTDNEILTLPEVKRCFTKLKTLKIFGMGWDPHIIFTLCIYNSNYFISLVLDNKNYLRPCNKEFLVSACSNLLSTLEELTLLHGFIIDFEIIADLITNCSNLKEISLISELPYSQLLDSLIMKNNYDLKLKTNMDYNNYCLCKKIIGDLVLHG